MVSRGRKPSCTAWRVTEKAPEMTACEAMTVAAVASEDHRDPRPVREEQEERVVDRARRVEDQRALAHVVEDQRREDDGEPRAPDRAAAEVAHVGVQRLGAR